MPEANAWLLKLQVGPDGRFPRVPVDVRPARVEASAGPTSPTPLRQLTWPTASRRPQRCVTAMDPVTSALLPCAQSVVTSVLTDGWTRLRDALAARWSRRTGEEPADIEQRLEAARRQAEGLGGDEAVQRAYWAGYLAAVLAERPDLLDAVRGLAEPGGVHNTNSGQVTTLVQARDVRGGISFGPQ